jgi:putative toxin-antitoxin system antitoxin component (TIGR02293 family)
MIEYGQPNITTLHYTQLMKILGEDLLLQQIDSPFDFITLASKGINAQIIKNFSSHFGFTRDFTAELLQVSEPTVYRWIRNDKVLERNYSVQIFELTDMFLFGIAVFDDQENFFKWLELPNIALGGMQPKELLDIPEGISKVKDLLGRIEHGVYS